MTWCRAPASGRWRPAPAGSQAPISTAGCAASCAIWIDAFRACRPEAPIEEWPDLPGQDGRTTTEARLTLQATQAAIAALPEEQRSVLVLVCVEEMSYRDAASTLDIPVGTVMSRLARARTAVAAALEGAPEPRTAGMGARR